VKFEQRSDPTGAADERRTRARVCREVLERGPVSAAQLADVLGLTPAGVRRHLDVLLAEGLIGVHDPVTGSAAGGRRPRGRPARRFILTDAGHAAMASGYDHLATSALEFLAEIAGPHAVRRFADQHVHDLETRYRPVVEAAGPDQRRRATALAEALSADGYAASARPLQGGAGGTQLCQGHCPVQHVAARFPELCEAETDAFSRLLGVHVQRLATLAHGEHVCTTHIPATQIPAQSPVPSSLT
jgi:predicted ArsR family transcriptional regulator